MIYSYLSGRFKSQSKNHDSIQPIMPNRSLSKPITTTPARMANTRPIRKNNIRSEEAVEVPYNRFETCFGFLNHAFVHFKTLVHQHAALVQGFVFLLNVFDA